jgi:hypothetical protein
MAIVKSDLGPCPPQKNSGMEFLEGHIVGGCANLKWEFQ